jgi:UDP-galactopyranose mutase
MTPKQYKHIFEEHAYKLTPDCSSDGIFLVKEADVVVVGSGFFGLTLAHRISTRSNLRVIVLEKRNHLGGNAFSFRDQETNIEVHQYGSHLFHTSNQAVWDFVKQFAVFTSYEHRVKTIFQGQVFSLPINLHTISQFIGRCLTPEMARDWVGGQKTKISNDAKNLEEQAIKLIGEPLYRAFVKGYTSKQWQTDPTDLPADIIKRLPVRFNFDDRYFDDVYQGLPQEGYGKLFEEMYKSGNFQVELGCDFDIDRYNLNDFRQIVYTGPIDRFFSYKFGTLGWRTLDFEFEKIDSDDFQGCSVMNYADIDVKHTRIHEFKHLHPERKQSNSKTIISREYSRFATDVDEPYYPINSAIDRDKLKKYRHEASKLNNVIFGGRLGRYQYLDMHMAIASAFRTADEIMERFGGNFSASKLEN